MLRVSRTFKLRYTSTVDKVSYLEAGDTSRRTYSNEMKNWYGMLKRFLKLSIVSTILLIRCIGRSKHQGSNALGMKPLKFAVSEIRIIGPTRNDLSENSFRKVADWDFWSPVV